MPRHELCCVTAVFNPAGYRSRLANYLAFAEGLARQGVNLRTVELAFGDEPHRLPESQGVLRLRGRSVLWQKERLINHAIERLPEGCRYVAWVDADLLFPDGWADRVVEALQTHDLVQPFRRVVHLPPGRTRFDGSPVGADDGIAWQACSIDGWRERRRRGELPFAAPGFAWASRRDLFGPTGLYDRMVCGGGDAFLADCGLGSFGLHHYARARTGPMAADMERWRLRAIASRPVSVGHVPDDLHHLWHGAPEHRGYRSRDQILLAHGFDPRNDITLAGGVYEWSSDKPAMHREVADYFFSRREDDPL